MEGLLTFLGTGTSMGVPTLGCECAVCTSADPRDRRLRPSALLRWKDVDTGGRERAVVIDTGPDFREQALRAGLKCVDAVFYTHSHADHILGMDDLRPLSFRASREGGPIPLYAAPETIAVLERVYEYTFSPQATYPTRARVSLEPLAERNFVHGVEFLRVPVMHGELKIAGFRFGRAAYLTDVSAIPEGSFALLEGVDVLVLSALRHGDLSEATLARLAVEVFQLTAAYDALIAEHLYERLGGPVQDPAEHLVISGSRRLQLRYGENPHQQGALYTTGVAPAGLAAAEQLQGGELSYTNWLDADSAWRLVGGLPQPAAVVVKHTNPCGAAVGHSAVDAFERAYSCDPRSAYGGIVGLNRTLDVETAIAISKHFLELVVAPDITPEAATQLAGRPRLRVLRVRTGSGSTSTHELRSVDGGFLLQDRDPNQDDPAQFRVVTRRHPTAEEWEDLRLAWQLVGGVKSNAIVLCKRGRAVGVGAGQMSRVEAIQLAIQRAGSESVGSCLASDAFFPMADNLEVAAAGGVTAAIHPGGSKRDQEVVEVAERVGMALVATGTRHFRH